MFEVKDDLTIYCTRGDVALFSVTADESGVNYIFQPGDVVRMKVFEKKDCQCVVMQKDVIIEETTDKVDILLTGQETRICEVISKPKDFWYEVELNPGPNQQTIIGYDEDGPKVFKMFPEGKEIEYEPGEQASFLEELVEKEVNEALTFGTENTGKLLYVGADGIADVLGIGEGLQITDGIITVDGEFNPDAEESAVLSVARLGVMRLGSTGGNGGNSNVVGIESIEQTVTSTEDGGVNEITATLTDGTTNVFHVKNGNKGSDGSNGKSAYEYAKDGGYTGTEEEFATKMAEEYVLPSASATVKGGVMVGKDLMMDGDTLNVVQTVHNKSAEVTNLFPENIEFVLRDFRKCGQLCQFVIQFNITETINSNYSFAVFELPCKSVGRVWLNNATQYYIAANENVIRRNASQISTGNITLSGMYLTNE